MFLFVARARRMLYTCSMRYLGIDYGTKKVGLALSDEAGTMGFPFDVIPNTPQTLNRICVLIAGKNIGAIVIGESRNFMGAENPIAKDARAFSLLLTERAGIPVFFESEVLTTAAARRIPGKEVKSRAMKRHVTVDAAAAALILTSYLSRTHHG